MYSLRDILSGYVKKERNAEVSPCNEQSSKTLFSKETFECSMENGNPVSSRASDLELGHQTDSLPDTFECSKESGNPAPFRAHDCGLDHQTGSSPLTSTNLVSLRERISPEEDYSKIRKRNVQGILPDKKRFKDDLVHRNRETMTSTSCSTATLMALKSAYPVPFSGEKSTQEDTYDQMSNMMSSYQKNSPPFKSAIKPLPSRGNFYAKEDESRIQLSKVYNNPYNAKAVKAFIDALTKKQCQFSFKQGSDQTSGHSKHQEMLSDEEQPIKQNRKMLFTNGSDILKRNQFTKLTAPKRDLSRSHPTRETSNFQSTMFPRRDQFPDMGATSKNGSVYRYETENYSFHNSSLEIIPCYHVYNIRPSTPNSHFTITPQHFRVMEEIAQQDDLANKIGVYKPEISFLNEKGKQCSQKSICGISKNLTRSNASSCQSYRQEQPRAHPAPCAENQRPSVIMVPASWSNISSRESHVPLKVDASFTERSDGKKGNVVDLDSSDDDDGGKEKYFQVNMDGKTATFKLTKEDWNRIPISTFPSGGRLLSGDWRKIFVNKVKESNPWCSLRFKNNHVRSENSRKIYSAVFFRGAAECKRPECSVKVRFVIQREKGKYVDVTYVGNVCHSREPGGNDFVSYTYGARRAQNT